MTAVARWQAVRWVVTPTGLLSASLLLCLVAGVGLVVSEIAELLRRR